MNEPKPNTVIAPDKSRYSQTRAASGNTSWHNGDSVALALDGRTLDMVYALAAEYLSLGGVEVTESALRKKYEHLNIGQQRMNLGNRIRGKITRLNKERANTIGKGGPTGEEQLKSLVPKYDGLKSEHKFSLAKLVNWPILSDRLPSWLKFKYSSVKLVWTILSGRLFSWLPHNSSSVK